MTESGEAPTRVPEARDVVPEARGVNPGARGMVPEARGSIPEARDMVPGAGGRMPEGMAPARVPEGLDRLAGLGGVPVREHVAIFEGVLTGLEATLASVDEEPPPAENGRR
ncbi:hypothetical protein [Sphaerisporangium sp. TRM90804]|uniref:hypothetical protein n=1 Tax=Sphaerisporangium sp. TRM90804 TaxID=3031113 RepID=UPI002446DE26|nr:hypothetical protein [Sphaerisporangium sp. TRM90804]MDH2430300.1 hypothetical protein [Sphaerisporangium sp. TRM90804]